MESEAVEIKIIGIAGVARVGKDTFCDDIINILGSQGINAQRVAFADALKKDINDFLVDKTGVKAYIREDNGKELIRPLLVAYGELMRELTGGKHWINKIKKEVGVNINNQVLSIVSDVRYPNEASWINSTRHGVTLHLSREGIKPANREEELNDPKTQKECSFRLQWETEKSTATTEFQTLRHLNGIKLLQQFIRLRSGTKHTNSSR